MTPPHRRRYRDISGHSGVAYYEPGATFIRIWFKSGEGYEYNEAHPGARHVAAMKQLAAEGQGLTTYINQHVRDDYAEKF